MRGRQALRVVVGRVVVEALVERVVGEVDLRDRLDDQGLVLEAVVLGRDERRERKTGRPVTPARRWRR